MAESGRDIQLATKSNMAHQTKITVMNNNKKNKSVVLMLLSNWSIRVASFWVSLLVGNQIEQGSNEETQNSFSTNDVTIDMRVFSGEQGTSIGSVQTSEVILIMGIIK